MKKRKILLLLIVTVLSVVVGFTAYPTIIKENINDHSSDNAEEISNDDTTKKIVSENSTEIIVQENSTSLSTETSKMEILSVQDKMVKAEIAKYIETNVDFRNDKREIVNGKAFDIVFSNIENCEQVVYENSLGDKFSYNAEDGVLRYAVIESSVTPKTAEGINQEKAMEIAVKYISSNINIEEYTMDYCKESDKGYYFCFTRYIGGYPSNDIYGIKVGYAGDIVYLSDNTNLFVNESINYDKNFIDSKIKEKVDQKEVDWNSIRIIIHEGKVAVEYMVPEQCAIAILPLE